MQWTRYRFCWKERDDEGRIDVEDQEGIDGRLVVALGELAHGIQRLEMGEATILAVS